VIRNGDDARTSFVIQTTLMAAEEAAMALIQLVEPDQATGKTKEIYDTMLKNSGVI